MDARQRKLAALNPRLCDEPQEMNNKHIERA